MHSEKEKVYDPATDVLRIISILAVVAIHTSTRLIEATSLHIQIVPITFFINQISRFAVPLFFMISGFVLELNYSFHINYLTYLKKRLSRIILPYIFWSFIYFYFVYMNHTENFFDALIQGNASYQLYFIPALLIFYFLFPLLHRYYQTISRKTLLIILGLVQVSLVSYDYYIHYLPFIYPVSVTLLNFYFFIIGIVASHHTKRITTFISKWKYLLLLCTLILAGYITFEGEQGYLSTKNYLTFYSQWRPSIFFYTFFLTAIIYYVFHKKMLHVQYLKTLARLSFFVFFVHIIVLEVLWNLIGKALFSTSHTMLQQLWFDPLFFLLTTGISFLLAYFISKIPLLRRISS